MADNFRDQINTARRAGYSDDEVISYLKDKNPKIAEALAGGYKPAEILDFLAPQPTMGEELVRKVGVGIRGASEALAPVASGAATGAAAGALLGLPTGIGAGPGAIAGGFAVPAADAAVMAYNKLAGGNTRLPSQTISNWLPGPRAESPGERVLQATTNALAGTAGSVGGGQAIVNAARTAPGITSQVAPATASIGQGLARAPIGQLVTAPVSAAVGQATTEATGNPLLGLIAGVGTSALSGLRSTKREAVPTPEDLLAKSKANYDILDKSGFQLDTGQFKQHMATLPAKLRSELGYVESTNPKVAGAFKELLSDAPKDVAEIQALRKIVGTAAKSADPGEKAVASRLLDEFDDYVMKAPPSAIVSGNDTAMKAWKEARAEYSKMKKGEMITDILDRAEVSQGSKEAVIASQLSSLAKNDKKMRFFTTEEQDAIREAAKGGTLQTMLRTLGKFTPMTPAAAIFTAVSPFGAYTAGAGYAAKSLAEVRRAQQVNRLAEQMRLGGAPNVIEGPLANEIPFVAQAVRNFMAQPSQNQLGQ